eukprot:216862_1
MADAMSFEKRFANALNDITSSSYFVNALKKYDLQDYTFEILTQKHRQDVFQLIGSQFTKQGGNAASVAYNVHETENASYDRFRHVIDHAIKRKLSIVVFDNNNQLAAVNIMYDVCDKHEYINYSTYPLKYTKRSDFVSDCAINHSFFSSLNDNIKYGLVNKGECLCYDLGTIRRDLHRQPGVHILFCPLLVQLLALSIKQVKYWITKANHPATVKHMFRTHNYFNGLDNNNNVAWYSYKTNAKVFFDEKFQNDEWYKNNLNEEYIFENINKMVSSSHLCCLNKLRKKYTKQEFVEHYIKAYTQKSKL